MTPYDFLVAPFADYVFMKRALAAALMIVLASAPMGVFMSLRRMTLVGDALAHALLPGVAAAVLTAGLSLWAMTLGGLRGFGRGGNGRAFNPHDANRRRCYVFDPLSFRAGHRRDAGFPEGQRDEPASPVVR